MSWLCLMLYIYPGCSGIDVHILQYQKFLSNLYEVSSLLILVSEMSIFEAAFVFDTKYNEYEYKKYIFRIFEDIIFNSRIAKF